MVLQEYIRLTNGRKPTKTAFNQWRAPKQLKTISPQTHSANFDESEIREEDLLPLQNLKGANRSENIEREVKQHIQGRRTSESPDFKPSLHTFIGIEYKPDPDISRGGTRKPGWEADMELRRLKIECEPMNFHRQ